MNLQQHLRHGFLVMLKYTLNPLARRLARSSFGPLAIVRHVGRRSGKQYETPIIVAPVTDGFVIELTYGHDVDWHKKRFSGRRLYAGLAWRGVCDRPNRSSRH